MPPLRDTRRSRRLSRKSPVQVEDYDWLRGIPSVPLFPSAAHVPVSLPSPSSSACTATDSDSPLLTHLPFTPGSSHTRNRKQGHIPRPPNAFMVFRSWLWNKDNLKSIERDNRNVSRIAGRYWNELSESERAPFRCMAEEAKARHAQLYPEYKYSPGSQKKPRVPSQRRSQRGADHDNAKCKKVADLLLGGLASRDLHKYVDEGEHERVQVPFEAQDKLVSVTEDASKDAYCAVPRNTHRRYGASRMEPLSRPEPENTPLPFVPTAPTLYTVPGHMLRSTEEGSEATPTPGPSEHTPELAYPPQVVEDFIPTNDIPYLSLDSCEDLMFKLDGNYLSPLCPSHLGPAAHSIFSGVKPQATSFVDSCAFGAYTVDPMTVPSPIPLATEFDYSSYFTPDEGLVPLGSPVFTSPFEPSTSMVNQSLMLGTLDQLFGQPVSPLTLLPTENW